MTESLQSVVCIKTANNSFQPFRHFSYNEHTSEFFLQSQGAITFILTEQLDLFVFICFGLLSVQ